jgi:hypothetical protein
MRKLTKKQTTILDGMIRDGINSYDDISMDVQNKLQSINDYETMWTDINRYIWDNKMKLKLR